MNKQLELDTFKLEVDTLKNDTLIIVDADDQGKYGVELEKDREYEITAQAQDLFFESFRLRIDQKDTTTLIEKTFYIPERINLRINFPTAKFDQPYKYSLDSNGVETYLTWQEELNLLAQNILLSQDRIKKIVLIGHTDDVGATKDNEILGQNRVNFVIEELVKRGVPRNFLEGKSAGELEPLEKKPKESMELYRKRLRRVELRKVI